MENTEVKTASEATKPSLWNPNAAVNWSVVFTPVFGAWLHAKNWKELNEPEKEKQSMYWVYGGILLLIILIFADASPAISVAYLIAWYLVSGKKQVQYIKEKNIEYDKKDWPKPIIFGVVGIVIYVCLSAMFGTSDESILEEAAVPTVTKMFSKSYGHLGALAPKCKAVKIKEKIRDGYYKAVAYIDNGKELNIMIEVKGEAFEITPAN